MKITKLLALTLIALATAAGSANAGASAKNPSAPSDAIAPVDDSLGFSISGGYDSKYIFRGVDFGDNLVWGSLSIPIKITDKLTFTFAPWYGNIADGEYDELDLAAGFSYDLGFGTLGLGYTWYYFPFSGFDTNEPNVTFQTCLGAIGACKINWFSGAFCDFEADAGDEGWYFETGLNTTIALTDTVSLVPEARLTYATDYYGQDGFNNVLVKLGAPVALTKTATLTPYIAGSIALEGLDGIGQDSELIGGVSLTVTF
jgi:hypothetical protein